MTILPGTKVLTLVALSLALAAATDYSCGKGKSEAEITIENNDSVEFKTQDPKKYKQAKCTVKYILGSSCAKMKFDCRQNTFSLAGGRKCNKKSKDKLSITTDEGKKTFCGKIKKKKQRPNISTAGNIIVSFVADKKKHSFGATCDVSCTEAATGATTSAPTGTTTGGSGPGNPGGAAGEITLSLEVAGWSQEPAGYTRTAQVTVPATTAGQKVPVLIHLHGNGGQGNTRPFGSFLGDEAVIVAPNGYERSWNVYKERSKADDVKFILDLITKIGQEIPAADMNNVNIAGTSNGAALTYQLIIDTDSDRPFRRAFPMVSSLISPQFHDDQFWTFTQSAVAGSANSFDTARQLSFAPEFEFAHFHGTEDTTINYYGQAPGPAFLGGADVIAAQTTDFYFARAMGFTGTQLADSAGVEVGTGGKSVEEYSYLGGKVRHYKLVGERHGTGPNHNTVQQILRNTVLGITA